MTTCDVPDFDALDAGNASVRRADPLEKICHRPCSLSFWRAREGCEGTRRISRIVQDDERAPAPYFSAGKRLRRTGGSAQIDAGVGKPYGS